MKRPFIVIIGLAAAIIIAIPAAYLLLGQQSSSNQTTPGPYGTPSPSTPVSNVANTVKFKTVEFIDSQGIGTKAFSMFIPTDWQTEGTIQWILSNPAMPVGGQFRAWNPTGTEEFNLFPNQAFFSSNNPMILQTFPAGSYYFGAEVKEPVGSIDALKQIVLPKFRANVADLQVVSEELLPSVNNLFSTGTDQASGVTTSADAGKIRVEYSQNGVSYEEEFYVVIQTQDIPVQTLYGVSRNLNWYLTYIESFRAAKGTLDEQSKTFQTISYFSKTDVNWLNKYNQVVNYLIQQQIQQIQSLGQLSNIISQTSSQISDENYQAWEQNQNVKDRLAKDFSNSILDIESYRNPFDGSTVDLPSGYNSVWTNSLGEYVFSDSASYNPNLESNLNWQQMTP